MKRQIVITGWQSKVLTALYEEDTLCELNLEPKKSQVRVGDIYIGKVKHIVQNIQAAFVEITPGVMGYYPLKDNAVHFFVNQKKNDKIVAGEDKGLVSDRTVKFSGKIYRVDKGKNRYSDICKDQRYGGKRSIDRNCFG